MRELRELHADVESGEQRQQRAARGVDLAERIRESEAVHETEAEGQRQPQPATGAATD